MFPRPWTVEGFLQILLDLVKKPFDFDTRTHILAVSFISRDLNYFSWFIFASHFFVAFLFAATDLYWQATAEYLVLKLDEPKRALYWKRTVCVIK